VTFTTLPEQGVIFWPIGTGDSTTIVVDDRLVMQVDLHDTAAADDSVVTPVIDRLADELPTLDDGTPYLAVFALTHADQDHCTRRQPAAEDELRAARATSARPEPLGFSRPSAAGAVSPLLLAA